uniref:MULE transposase domain-containing protein n=1 Tax=Mycena chlorophos TaxID=658473 RepID=A0ABQ0LIJ3_MYCCL|nr:predicted protein [Mycena chlorophos]
MNVQRIIKRYDRESWGSSSGGHKDGDAHVYGFSDDLAVGLLCKRISGPCNGIDVCELVPDGFLADCVRLEDDPQATLDLWHQHLDANQQEAATVSGLLLRFHSYITSAKCPKAGCGGSARLVLLSDAPNQYGKSYYVGCSERGADRPLDHIWIPIPVHLDEDALEFVMENDGKLPPGMFEAHTSVCNFSAHPKLGLKHCWYGHSVDDVAKTAVMVNRPCDAEIIIYVPVDEPDGTPIPEWARYMAMLLIRQYHNHAVYPDTQPTLEDRARQRTGRLREYGTARHWGYRTPLHGEGLSTAKKAPWHLPSDSEWPLPTTRTEPYPDAGRTRSGCRGTRICPVSLRAYPDPVRCRALLEDEQKLAEVIDAIGVENLTVQRLRAHLITKAAYGGLRIAKVSPGFANSRRVKDFIRERAAVKFPKGMGWDGVVHYMTEIQPTLSPSEHYIHAAICRADFSIIVTMHPGIADLVHLVLAFCIDYSFKRVEGKLNEWKIASMIPRYNKRTTLATIYCDGNTRDAFACLFTELFAAIKHITGTELALRPWRPDATCRAIILDGEVAQAQGLGDFLVWYNNPQISGINSRDPLDLVTYSMKTCQVHFRRNIDEKLARTAKTLSGDELTKLRSYPQLRTHAEIAEWHQWCSDHSDTDLQNWYAQKRNNPWYLATMNEITSKMRTDDYRLTPNSSNTVESAHAGLNAQTNIQLPPLSAILSNKESDDLVADEHDQIETGGVISNDNNGLGQRERLMAQRMRSKVKKCAVRQDGIAEFQALEVEEAAGDATWSASLDREKVLQAEIKRLRGSKVDAMKLKVKALRKKVNVEVELQRAWRKRKGEIKERMKALRDDELHGVRIPRAAVVDTAFDHPTAFGLDPTRLPSPPSEETDLWNVYGELPDEFMDGLFDPPTAEDRLDFQIALNNSFFATLNPIPPNPSPPPPPFQAPTLPMPPAPNLSPAPPPFQLDQDLDPDFRASERALADERDVDSAPPTVAPSQFSAGPSTKRQVSTRRGKKREREEDASAEPVQPSRKSAREPVKSTRAKGHSYDDRWVK